MPMFSIIVPIYNVEDYLEECLESLRKQSFGDFEVLCIVDGSPDNSIDIARRYEGSDKRFRVYEKPNGGLSSARNYGINHASGDFLAFVDADDRVTNDFCERLFAAFSESGANAVVFGASVFPPEANTPWYDEVLSPEDAALDDFSTSFMFAPYTTPFAWRCAVRRDALLRSQVLFDEHIPFGEDVIFQFALYPRIGALASISDKLYEYRLNRSGSLMDEWGTDERRLKIHVDMVSRVFEDWKSLGLIGEYGAELFTWSIDNLLYGVERLPEDRRREQYGRAHALWTRYFAQGAHPLEIEEGCICRGEGKLYWECGVRSVMPFELLEIRATVNGFSLPACAYPRTDEESGCAQQWVFELPWMAADAIHIELVPDGRSYECASLTCNYEKAKWLSRLNYRIHATACEGIRDFERKSSGFHYLVEARERFPRGEAAVWRFSAEWEGPTDRLPDFKVYDAEGRSMKCPVHVMEFQANEQSEGSYACRAVVSVEVPALCDHFLVSVAGDGDSVQSGFAVVDPEASQAAERIAENFMKHAGEDDDAYRAWFSAHAASPSKLETQQGLASWNPVSIGCIVVEEDLGDGCLLDDTIASLHAQSYRPSDVVVLRRSGAPDRGLTYFSSTGEAISHLECDYVAFLASGDVVEPDALFEYASAIEQARERGDAPGFLYCDEDVRDSNWKYGSPIFKSPLNLDLLYCGNWVGNLMAIRVDVLEQMQMDEPVVFRTWAYGCALRAYEVGAHFEYVPRVLHHARMAPFPGNPDELREVLQAHLDRRGVNGLVEERSDRRGIRVRYELPSPRPLVSIVIPSKDQSDLLEACVNSIEQLATYHPYEIVIVENNSVLSDTPQRYRVLEESYDNVRVVHWQGDFNYSAIVNFGADQARGDYLLFLNNDTRVIAPSFIEEMLGFLQRPEVGVVGAKLLFEDGLVQHAGMVVGVWDAVAHVNQNRSADQGGYLDRACLPGEFSAVTGACQMASRKTFEEVGGYDERFVVGFNDVDFCLRVRQAGKSVVLAPDAVLYHLEFASRGREVEGARLIRWRRERAEFSRRWPDPFVAGDPFTSPNLKRDNTYYWLDDDVSKRDDLHGVVQLARKAIDYPLGKAREVRRAYDQSRDKTGNGSGYHRWFVRHHRATAAELERQRSMRLAVNPVFSLIVPLYQTPRDYFEEMADSVLNQTYGSWELVLVNASPEDDDLRAAVDELAQVDSRVVVRELACNLGITLNTNEGIRASSGDFLCFFDHDDVLEPNALFEYAQAINDDPEIDMLYCDEDKLLDGRYIGGFFKPDYDDTLMRSANYVTHFLAVRASIIESFDELPGPEFDGAQDHNMTMRAAEHARAIRHVPKVLYHWRIHEGSTADDEGAKLWACESGRLAVRQHLERLGVEARVDHHDEFAYVFKVAYVPQPSADEISIVVMADDAAKLATCLETIAESNATACEALVAWYGDGDEAARFSSGSDWVCGASRAEALNGAVKRARGSLVAVVASDVVPVGSGWLDDLAMQAARENVWACGPKLLCADDSVRSVGVVMSKGVPVRFDAGAARRQRDMHLLTRFPREITALDPDCFVIRRDEYIRSGGLDENVSYNAAALGLFFELWDRGGAIVVDPSVEMRMRFAGEDGLNGQDFVQRDEIEKLASVHPARFHEPDPHYNENYAAGSARFELE